MIPPGLDSSEYGHGMACGERAVGGILANVTKRVNRGRQSPCFMLRAAIIFALGFFVQAVPTGCPGPVAGCILANQQVPKCLGTCWLAQMIDC